MGDKILRLRKWIIMDAIILLALSAYEFITRVDAMWGPLKMFVSMAVGENISFKRAAGYVDIGVFEVPGFMMLCMVLSLLSLMTIRKRKAGFVLLSFSLAMAVWGLFVQMSLLGELIRYAKVLPLMVMSVLYVVLMFVQRAHLRLLHQQAQRAGYLTGYAPIQPQHMEGRRFQHGIIDHPQRMPKRRRAS